VWDSSKDHSSKYRLHLDLVRCEHRCSAMLGRNEARERWRAQALVLISIDNKDHEIEVKLERGEITISPLSRMSQNHLFIL